MAKMETSVWVYLAHRLLHQTTFLHMMLFVRNFSRRVMLIDLLETPLTLEIKIKLQIKRDSISLPHTWRCQELNQLNRPWYYQVIWATDPHRRS